MRQTLNVNINWYFPQICNAVTLNLAIRSSSAQKTNYRSPIDRSETSTYSLMHSFFGVASNVLLYIICALTA